MKPFSSVRCFFLALLLIAATPVRTIAADGDLDLGFDPPNFEGQPVRQFRPYRDHVYFASGLGPSDRIRRLRDDGRLDPDWELRLPSPFFLDGFTCLPAGGFAVLGSSGTYVDYASGSLTRIAPASQGSVGPWEILARDDGSLVTPNRLRLVDSDGWINAAFGGDATLTPASFFDGAGGITIGGPSVKAVQDSRERLILVGNFLQAGKWPRLGLVRLDRDGQVDPSWNPGPALGIALEETNLTAMPRTVSLGPNDSVVVGMQLQASDGQGRQRLATVDSNGAVVMSVLVTNQLSSVAPAVQPDGRILVPGRFTNWNGQAVTGLVRLTPEGEVDPSFQVSFGERAPDFFADLILDKAGRLLVAGSFSSVNGTPRSRLARLLAYTPEIAPPNIVVTATRPRIATNEVLWLAGAVEGYPPPSLQWYRNGEPLAGATNRGLRLAAHSDSTLGEFELVAWNSSGTNTTRIATVGSAVRSPRPGLLDPNFDAPLPQFTRVTQLLPLPDGRILVASDSWTAGSHPVVGRLHPDGSLDSSFGDGGVLRANAAARHLSLLPDGGVLVAGSFTEFAGDPAAGLVALDARGQRLPLSFPPLDIPFVSCALRQPDGKFVIAGGFTLAANQPSFRLARLREDGTLDPTFTSPLEPWQSVDALALDAQNRILIGGAFADSSGPTPGNTPVGLQRLLPNGSLDPTFQSYPGRVRSIIVEPTGTLLVGVPPVRLTEDGAILVEFQRAGVQIDAFSLPPHRLVRLPDGGVVFPVESSIVSPFELIRWHADGRRDADFRYVNPDSLIRERVGPSARAAALLADGSVLIATAKVSLVNPPNWEELLRLRRLLPDSDLKLSNPGLAEGRFRADLATQPGVDYEVRSRSPLGSPGSEVLYQKVGDGYVDEISTSGEANTGFLELRRDRIPQ